MANEEHVERLRQGVQKWNQWRDKAFFTEPELRGTNLHGFNLRRFNLRSADLCGADLRGADLRGADLRRADLRGAYLRGADLRGADLRRADLRGAYLCGADLRGADLRLVNLHGFDLRGADPRGVNLSDADLRNADFRGANLYGANLYGFDLSGINLSNTNLGEANLRKTQVLGTNFERATFTGACLEDWNTNGATQFDSAICDYVYLKASQQERRPREGKFKPGEFATLFQQAVETVDLIFKDGIDWQAFFHSFQDLRSQYTDKDLSIQAIEKKRGGAFVVRLEVAKDADKATIEGSAKELYETKLTLLEQRYRAELQAKDGEIVAYREQSANLMKITELLGAKIMPSEINQTFNAPVGNAAGSNYGNMSAIQNNYGPNTEDITRLLAALRDQAQTFPTDQKDDANDALDLLEPELKAEQPDPKRISRQLKKLVALGAAIGTIASGAAAVSGDVSTFTGNVIELTQQLGIPIEQVQLPSSNQP